MIGAASAAAAAEAAGALTADGAGFAVCTKILARIKAKAPDMTDTAGAAAMVYSTVGLRRILDERQPVPLTDLQQGIEVGRLPIEMYW